jgi:hypothetical protein
MAYELFGKQERVDQHEVPRCFTGEVKRTGDEVLLGKYVGAAA